MNKFRIFHEWPAGNSKKHGARDHEKRKTPLTSVCLYFYVWCTKKTKKIKAVNISHRGMVGTKRIHRIASDADVNLVNLLICDVIQLKNICFDGSCNMKLSCDESFPNTLKAISLGISSIKPQLWFVPELNLGKTLITCFSLSQLQLSECSIMRNVSSVF